MNRKTLVAGMTAICALAVAACGSGEDAERSFVQETDSASLASNFDVADLPGDFPQALIPPRYTTAEYVDLTQINGTRAVNFESTENVQGAIDHYIGLLGEPTINIDSGDGDRMVQWQESPHPPWLVSVMGRADETIISVATLPKQ